MKLKQRFGIAAATISFIAGCGTLDGPASLGGDLVTDAMALNKAYGDVGSSVIVTNVLRARDRWPTSYTTLTAINSTPSLTRASDINLNPLGLGNPLSSKRGHQIGFA